MRCLRALCVIAAVLLMAACTSSGGGPVPASPPVPTVPPNPPNTGLARLLIDAPPGSRMGRTEWAAEYTPTAAQFVDRFYDPADRAPVLARLRAEGIRHIAHNLWVTKQAVDADIILMQFRTDRDAQSRLLFATGASERDPKLAHYRLAAPGRPLVFYDKQLDDLGDILGRVYARVGNVVVEIFVGSPSRLDKRDIQTWTRHELGELRAG